jgi:phosphatidate cytidylyltransferase
MSFGDQELKPRSDLGVRTASGIVMMGVAILAMWLGGWVFGALIIAVGLAVYWEWVRLVVKFTEGTVARSIWIVAGIIYIALACFALLWLGIGRISANAGVYSALTPIAAVIGTDIGAYFAGRTFGGPKIAASISPSKTWSGLVGGAIGASLAISQTFSYPFSKFWGDNLLHPSVYFEPRYYHFVILGIAVAVIAQSGDFFESWMKRRAGVKDSGNLIPGHGGVFDRTDGIIAVAFVIALFTLAGVL